MDPLGLKYKHPAPSEPEWNIDPVCNTSTPGVVSNLANVNNEFVDVDPVTYRLFTNVVQVVVLFIWEPIMWESAWLTQFLYPPKILPDCAVT